MQTCLHTEEVCPLFKVESWRSVDRPRCGSPAGFLLCSVSSPLLFFLNARAIDRARAHCSFALQITYQRFILYLPWRRLFFGRRHLFLTSPLRLAIRFWTFTLAGLLDGHGCPLMQPELHGAERFPEQSDAIIIINDKATSAELPHHRCSLGRGVGRVANVQQDFAWRPYTK